MLADHQLLSFVGFCSAGVNHGWTGRGCKLNEAKREIYLEAKSNGFDVKVLREVVRLRKQDQKEREEHESLLEVYLRAINGARVSKVA